MSSKAIITPKTVTKVVINHPNAWKYITISRCFFPQKILSTNGYQKHISRSYSFSFWNSFKKRIRKKSKKERRHTDNIFEKSNICIHNGFKDANLDLKHSVFSLNDSERVRIIILYLVKSYFLLYQCLFWLPFEYDNSKLFIAASIITSLLDGILVLLPATVSWMIHIFHAQHGKLLFHSPYIY